MQSKARIVADILKPLIYEELNLDGKGSDNDGLNKRKKKPKNNGMFLTALETEAPARRDYLIGCPINCCILILILPSSMISELISSSASLLPIQELLTYELLLGRTMLEQNLIRKAVTFML
jgi:hypothetical protein